MLLLLKRFHPLRESSKSSASPLRENTGKEVFQALRFLVSSILAESRVTIEMPHT